jgi:hypothetical protein
MADPHLQHPRPRGQGGRYHRGPRIPKTIRFPEEVAIEIETDLAGRGVTFNDYVVELVLKARAAAAAAAPNGGPVAAVLPAARKAGRRRTGRQTIHAETLPPGATRPAGTAAGACAADAARSRVCVIKLKRPRGERLT